MPLATKTSPAPSSSTKPSKQASLDEELDSLCQRVLAYARKAKVQHFRYCRSPHRPPSPYRSIQPAIQALRQQLDEAAASSLVCQSQAVDFLRELASLAHQPPCENARQRKAVALAINTALLELR